MATGSITFGGLASGLPADIVDQMMQAEQIRLNSLNRTRSEAASTQSSFSTLESKMLSLKSKSEDLQDASYFRPHSASSSDEDKMTVSADSDALAAIHSITINSLATHDTYVSSTGVTTDGATLDADTTISLDYNGTTYNINLTAGDNLATIADTITNETYDSDDGTGISASVLNDGSNYRLVFTAKDSGLNSGSARLDLSGIGSLSFEGGTEVLSAGTTGANDGSAWYNSTAGQDASLTVDGIDVTTTSNSVSEVLDGVTMELKETGTVNLTIANDTEGLQTNLQGFLDSFNDVVAYVTNNKEAFGGESLARSVISQMRNEINTVTHDSDSPYSELSPFSTLASIGVETDQYTGQLSIDTSVLEDAMETDYNAIANIFVSKPTTTDESAFETAGGEEGLAYRLEDLIDNLTTGSDSAFGGKEESMQARLDSIDTTIEREQMRLEKVRDRLTRQFANLEQLMSQMQATQASLQSSLGGLS
uniref:Flagellar hook-associated protein 2 n=1 Tax=Magnetococcus massalia (strain MO-1) TaxID=451514 RepID=A0A1S7LNL4_MAGMO|nr:putative Flagellar hook-associated domain protein 2, fliD [Candidatus Magnetococcus massalia]